MKRKNVERAVRAGFKQGLKSFGEQCSDYGPEITEALAKIDAKSDPYYEREINLIVLSLSSEKSEAETHATK